MNAESFAALLNAHPSGAGRRWMAHCPAHSDRSASLSVREGRNGATLLHCFAGCRTEDVLTALQLTFKDICGVQTPASRAVLAKRRAEDARAKYRSLVIFISSAARGLAGCGDVALAAEYRAAVKECGK